MRKLQRITLVLSCMFVLFRCELVNSENEEEEYITHSCEDETTFPDGFFCINDVVVSNSGYEVLHGSWNFMNKYWLTLLPDGSHEYGTITFRAEDGTPRANGDGLVWGVEACQDGGELFQCDIATVSVYRLLISKLAQSPYFADLPAEFYYAPEDGMLHDNNGGYAVRQNLESKVLQSPKISFTDDLAEEDSIVMEWLSFQGIGFQVNDIYGNPMPDVRVKAEIEGLDFDIIDKPYGYIDECNPNPNYPGNYYTPPCYRSAQFTTGSNGKGFFDLLIPKELDRASLVLYSYDKYKSFDTEYPIDTARIIINIRKPIIETPEIYLTAFGCEELIPETQMQMVDKYGVPIANKGVIARVEYKDKGSNEPFFWSNQEFLRTSETGHFTFPSIQMNPVDCAGKDIQIAIQVEPYPSYAEKVIEIKCNCN